MTTIQSSHSEQIDVCSKYSNVRIRSRSFCTLSNDAGYSSGTTTAPATTTSTRNRLCRTTTLLGISCMIWLEAATNVSVGYTLSYQFKCFRSGSYQQPHFYYNHKTPAATSSRSTCIAETFRSSNNYNCQRQKQTCQFIRKTSTSLFDTEEPDHVPSEFTKMMKEKASKLSSSRMEEPSEQKDAVDTAESEVGLPAIFQQLEKKEKHDCARPTENGGFTHTKLSKSKISAANKGNTPWNKGRKRSAADKAKIAEGVRRRNRKVFLEKLAKMGLTEDEYEQQKKEERREKERLRRARKTANGGYTPTAETKAKISKVLKEKHAKGEIKRNVDPAKVRRGYTHSDETRKKISEALRKRWATDPTYREKMVKASNTVNTREDVRKRVSESLRKRWQEPEFRSMMMEKIRNRKSSGASYNEAHRAKISAAMKEKWQDAEFRSKSEAAMTKRRIEMGYTAPKRKRTKKKKPATTITMVQPLTSKGRTANGADEPTVMKNINGLLQPLRPMTVPQPRKRAKTVKKKKTSPPAAPIEVIAVKPKTPRVVVTDDSKVASILDDNDDDDVTMANTVVDKPKPRKRKARKTGEKAPGDVDLMKEERRDLYDLLYGDDDGSRKNTPDLSTQADSLLERGSLATALYGIHDDEDLDTFDPYGLED